MIYEGFLFASDKMEKSLIADYGHHGSHFPCPFILVIILIQSYYFSLSSYFTYSCYCPNEIKLLQHSIDTLKAIACSNPLCQMTMSDFCRGVSLVHEIRKNSEVIDLLICMLASACLSKNNEKRRNYIIEPFPLDFLDGHDRNYEDLVLYSPFNSLSYLDVVIILLLLF